jgi:cation:H+ antiporter
VNLLLFVAGLTALVVGANLLVRGASKLALSFGISPLVVGLTVVAFGTSAPEVAVSVGAVLDGKTDIALGNVVGSNVFNVLFILGISALITPLLVNVQLIRQEVPIMIGVSLLLLALSLDGKLGLIDGALLLGLLIAYTTFLVVQSRGETKAAQDEYAQENKPAEAGAWDAKLPAQIALIVAGLVALVFGSEWLVTASIAFAKAMGVSDLVIGLTIVAAGTSMPEVAASPRRSRASATSPSATSSAATSSTSSVAWACPASFRAVLGWACRRQSWPSTSGSCSPWRWPACRSS